MNETDSAVAKTQTKDLSLLCNPYPLSLCRLDKGNKVVYSKKPGATLDFAAERAEIARQRRALDEYEHALDIIEQRQRLIASGGLTPLAEMEKAPEGLTPAVRMAIQVFGETEFTVRRIEQFLMSRGVKLPSVDPRGRIAMILKKLLETGQVELTYKGSGRDPHRYKTKQIRAGLVE